MRTMKRQHRPTMEMCGISKSGLPQPWGTRFARHRAQAKFRGEAYELSAEQWYGVWVDSGHHLQCGRCKGSYSMKRIDESQPWAEDNVHIIRREQLAPLLGRRYAEEDYLDKNSTMGV